MNEILILREIDNRIKLNSDSKLNENQTKKS